MTEASESIDLDKLRNKAKKTLRVSAAQWVSLPPRELLALIERVRNDGTPVTRWENRAKRMTKQRDRWRDRAESAERRIERVERLRDLMEEVRDGIDDSVRLYTILGDLNAALTEGDKQ